MKYDLENIGEDTYLIFSRGNHNIEDFTKYVKAEYSEWGNFFGVAYWHYYRKVGNQQGSWYEPCFKWTRGSFPVTIAQEGWEDQTQVIADKIKGGKHLLSIGNYYVFKHRYMKDRCEVWYATNDCVATELRTFDDIEVAERFIQTWLNEGRL
ncbi:MAG: hypothetical protein RR959_08550 [Erysipelotrichaceae bacterium]